MRLRLCPLFPLASTCVASVNLYVASYSGGPWAGNVTTLSLGENSDSTFSLNQIATVNTSTNSPSWLTLDRQNGILYLIDEAVNSTNGTVVAYRPNRNGQLTELGRQKTLAGGVSATLYAGGRGLAVAQYSSGTLQSFNVSSPGTIVPLQTFNFKRAINPLFVDFTPGPIYDRQRAPHPHQAILDPSGQNLFVPDLGSDKVHILSVGSGDSLKLTRLATMKTKEGTGPRHGAFIGNGTEGVKFYLVGELDGSVSVFNIRYRKDVPPNSRVDFYLMAKYDTLAPGQDYPPNPSGSTKVAPAGIIVSQDGSTLVVGNRNDTTFGTQPPTDSIASFDISNEDGTLTKKALVSAYGSFPRQFALNRAGDLLAVGLQNTGSVVVLRRNPTSNLFNEKVAAIQLPHGLDIPVCIAWAE